MTNTSSLPHREDTPHSLITPPLTAPISRPYRYKALANIAVDVVFPWEPATARTFLPCIIHRRASERCNTTSPFTRACMSSGLLSRTALETTTVSAPLRWEASCPIKTVIPASRSESATSESDRSDPLTSSPFSLSTRAIPLIPEPAIPIQCTRPSSSGRERPNSGFITEAFLRLGLGASGPQNLLWHPRRRDFFPRRPFWQSLRHHPEEARRSRGSYRA